MSRETVVQPVTNQSNVSPTMDGRIDQNARWLMSLIAITGMTMTQGCQEPRDLVTPDDLERGLVLMLPGVEGRSWQLSDAVTGLRDAGIEYRIEIPEWGSGLFRSLRNLTQLSANLKHAGTVAGRIVEYRRENPDAPIAVIGYSGGGGMAILVAEALPDDTRVDRIILIAAALSPRHDLSAARAHCRGEIVNFYSKGDWFTLGLGTRVFGTVDRSRSKSAGFIGFRDEQDGLLQQDGLTQIAWREDWRGLGHNGGHLGWLARGWSRDVLAPRIDPALGEPAETIQSVSAD